MAYWIHDNGETVGPMRAIDVMRRAKPSTRICDGKVWFVLDDEEETRLAVEDDDEPEVPEHIVIRYSQSESSRRSEADEVSDVF